MQKTLLGLLFLLVCCGAFTQQSKNYYWPKKMENEYLRGCVLGAKQSNLSQLDAQRVCACNLKKVKKGFNYNSGENRKFLSKSDLRLLIKNNLD